MRVERGQKPWKRDKIVNNEKNYEGMLKNSFRCEKGTFAYEDGSEYIEILRNNKIHGKVIFFYRMEKFMMGDSKITWKVERKIYIYRGYTAWKN